MPPKDDDLEDDDFQDDEEEFLEEMGLGADGTRMQLGDRDFTGRLWEPDRGE
jgi:predicted NUDIX family NTP pyrophosphohydrolase